ncbi:MAG TPA: type III pantothenate kinase [Thermomicrobiales bacterium]|nr:type III pantothenate kinase [Thermomicrobiales bacterium]
MLLVVDVGNTNTMFGVYEMTSGDLLSMVRTATRHDRMPDEWYAILQPTLQADGVDIGEMSDMVISSVVPSVTRWLGVMGKNRLQVEPIIVSGSLDLGLPIDMDNPAEVGADRLVNSIAAIHRYGAPVIAIDFGTALNFDVVDARGHYIGGSLAPGIVIALEAMTSRAAKLFSVELVPPPTAIARNTTNAIQSGLVLGYVSLVEGMIRRICDELGTTPPIVVTGGYSEIIARQTPLIDHHDPDLTIAGLWHVYQRIRR